MIINHNMASLNTYRQLSTNNAASSKSLEKLSSGLRINRAGDDAAGLAISEKMRGQIRGLDQASRNAQDSISMIQTAEGSLNEVHSILQRMKELATQAANDTNVGADRTEIQKEMNQLTSEINRIGNTTEFNTQKLLNGGDAKISVVNTTANTTGALKGAFSTVQTNTASVTGKVTGTATDANDYTITITATDVGTDLSGKTVKFVQGALSGGAVSVATSGNDITITVDQDVTNIAVINNAIANQGSLPVKFTVASSEGTTITGDTLANTDVTLAGGAAAETTGNYSFDLTSAFANAGETVSIGGKTFSSVAGAATAASGEFSIDGTANDQATSLVAALNADTDLNANYTFTAVGTKIVATEKTGQAQGTALTATVSSSAARAGDYGFTVDQLEVGSKYAIDGVEIAVIDDASDTRLAKGTAILAGATASEQAANLKTALSLNTALNTKYDASASSGTTINLVQNAGHESGTAPAVTTSNKSESVFQAKFQIGANTAQSMTIEISDMRSAALKISGTTAGDAVTASNGSKASLKAVKEVTDGTDNASVEYALDVSDHDKATAAISVLDDAIQSVSAERSKLGAYQNRLEHTINNLGTSSENLTAAESRIRDVDMAKEMMNFQKNNILSQAAQAMLAQANQQPQGVLQLLR